MLPAFAPPHQSTCLSTPAAQNTTLASGPVLRSPVATHPNSSPARGIGHFSSKPQAVKKENAVQSPIVALTQYATAGNIRQLPLSAPAKTAPKIEVQQQVHQVSRHRREFLFGSPGSSSSTLETGRLLTAT